MEPAALRDRALLELLYAGGVRISEALGLDREDLSIDGAFVRVIGKGDRERLVPIGEIALGVARQVRRRTAPHVAGRSHVAPERGGPLFLATGGAASAGSRAGPSSRQPPARPGCPTR